MTKKKQISCGAKSIVLTDEQMVDAINELLAKSDYNYNFNKLANDLLARGIDSFKVDDKPTEEVKPKEEEWEDRSESVQVCEFMEELVGLMKENMDDWSNTVDARQRAVYGGCDARQDLHSRKIPATQRHEQRSVGQIFLGKRKCTDHIKRRV